MVKIISASILYYKTRVNNHFCFEERRSRSRSSSLGELAAKEGLPADEITKLKIKGGRIIKVGGKK